MAYIDLKECQFFVEDGYSKTGAANVSPGPIAKNTTAIIVDGFTGVVASGTRVQFANHDTLYELLSTVETSGNTTTLNIDPGLTATVADGEVVAVGPRFVEARIGDGNLTYDEARVIEYKLNRGKLDQARAGDETPLSVNFQFAWEYLASAPGATVPTIEEAIKLKGPAATWNTTGGECEPKAVNIVMIQTRENCETEAYPIEKITLQQFRHETLSHDPKAGTVTCTGKCNVTEALIERLAA